MIRNLIILVVLIPALVSAFTPHYACTGGRPLPLEVRVPGCFTQPCQVVQGALVMAEADFIAANGALGLTPYIWLTLLGVHIPFPIEEEFLNACDFLSNGACPFAPGTGATFHIDIPIPVFLIGLVTVEMSLLDQTGDTVACAMLDIFVSSAQ